MVPANVDTDGNLQVDILAALPSGTNLIGDVQARNLGYIGGAWRKDPLRFGYSGQVVNQVVTTTLAAGVNDLDTGAVPADTIWVITQLSAAYVGTIGTVNLFVQHVTGATLRVLFSESHVVTSEYIDRQGWWVAAAGDKFRLRVTGATLNDDAYFNANGFYVSIAL